MASSNGVNIPPWGLYMMLIASALGTFFLFRQLQDMGWPKPFGGSA
jgi:hypothetical protein